MKPLHLTFIACAFACVPAGAPAQSAEKDSVRVYDSTQLALAHYTVLKRLWVEGWKSALWITGYRDESSARRALLDEAARLGADGVINLHCLSRTDAIFNPSGYYCYGNAIKLKAAREAMK
ncbi:MAG: hypothetical protein JWN13_3644 [Betaproteobacteria bacterium]|jgi:hypothetical protein|nr:hypothetical protein [Betaproteobacteria bacterium]MEA3156843.1 hypothetical protein [Betaproteobacteria bacterium]